jgi:hypothetical protein
MEYGCCGPFTRRYLSKEEKIALLKRYKENLQNEMKGVEDRIKELTQEGSE